MLRRNTTFSVILALAVLQGLAGQIAAVEVCQSGCDCKCAHSPHIARQYQRAGWYVVETEAFQICCRDSLERASNLARHAENLRGALHSKWLGASAEDAWQPKCQIVLHANRQSYLAAVGPGGERTRGSSLVHVQAGRIASRQIDLLAERTDYLSAALPHELTHVVVCERFASHELPRWADEGMAIVADPAGKRSLHLADLDNALERNTAFRLADLLMMDKYPRAEGRGTFYGQSASLTAFLIERKSPAQFVSFIERATAAGYDTALQECYGIAGVADLERQWRRYAHVPRESSLLN